MARENIFIEEIRQAEPPQFEHVESTHADVIVDIFVQILREALSNHPIYTYVPREDSQGPDYELTRIVVVDKYTEEAMFLPIITMSFNSANTAWIQFSQSPFNTVVKPQMNPDGSIKRDSRGRFVPSHYEYVGSYESSISFLISAGDTIEREELCNLIHVLLVETLRDELLLRGVFVKTVNVGGQTETQYRNNYIYQAPVTVEVYSEWRRVIPVGDTVTCIGVGMTIDDGYENVVIPQVPEEPACIINLNNYFYVKDDETGEMVLPDLVLSATSEAAPVTLVYDTLMMMWKVSSFWKKVINQTLIPYDNFRIELNKESAVKQYLDHAARSIMQATRLRALALSQGRKLPDGTKVIGQAFIYTDGKVELKSGFSTNDPLIYSTVVEPDNTVIVRFVPSNRNRHVLVAKNVIQDAYGAAISGQIFKRIVDSNGDTVDVQLVTADEDFLLGENINSMTAVDLFMIMQYADQPFRFTLAVILDEIDSLLNELADMDIPITNRLQKITNLTIIKQDLIARSEKFLLRQPVGL